MKHQSNTVGAQAGDKALVGLEWFAISGASHDQFRSCGFAAGYTPVCLDVLLCLVCLQFPGDVLLMVVLVIGCYKNDFELSKLLAVHLPIETFLVGLDSDQADPPCALSCQEMLPGFGAHTPGFAHSLAIKQTRHL